MATTGFQTLAGQAGGEGHGVLLGDADVVVTIGNSWAKRTRPEPSRMAGVMPTRRGSAAAMSHSQSPKTWV